MAMQYRRRVANARNKELGNATAQPGAPAKPARAKARAKSRAKGRKARR